MEGNVLGFNQKVPPSANVISYSKLLLTGPLIGIYIFSWERMHFMARIIAFIRLGCDLIRICSPDPVAM